MELLRLLDANLDRAREGLRVAEDWARFVLDRRDLVEISKDLRQQLGRCHQQRYRQARHTATDSAKAAQNIAEWAYNTPQHERIKLGAVRTDCAERARIATTIIEREV